jgi:hypothetical protein
MRIGIIRLHQPLDPRARATDTAATENQRVTTRAAVLRHTLVNKWYCKWHALAGDECNGLGLGAPALSVGEQRPKATSFLRSLWLGQWS